MTSNINFSAINEQYPVAGQDNNSQGFRDNFAGIKAGLSTAKAEISDLQLKSLINQDLISSDPVTNDLKGSSITNGFYNNFHGLSYIATVNGTTNIVTNSASVFVYTLTGNTTFTFTNWPTNTHYAKVKVHFTSADTTPHTVSLFSTGGGTIKPDNQFPAPFSVTSASHKVIEAWTYNHGATVFVKYLGAF